MHCDGTDFMTNTLDQTTVMKMLTHLIKAVGIDKPRKIVGSREFNSANRRASSLLFWGQLFMNVLFHAPQPFSVEFLARYVILPFALPVLNQKRS